SVSPFCCTDCFSHGLESEMSSSVNGSGDATVSLGCSWTGSWFSSSVSDAASLLTGGTMGMTFLVGLGLINNDDSPCFMLLGNKVALFIEKPEFPKIFVIGLDGLNSGAKTLKR